MIKFFRNIRKSLLSQGKTTKYFKYALGEIVLVVIGILIALQINNWNEYRVDRKLEKTYLERLMFEIQKDTSFFNKEILKNERKNQLAKRLIDILSNTNIEDSILYFVTNQYLEEGWIYPKFTLANSTFNDLSNTGNINIIRDLTLRDKILNYYAFSEEIEASFQGNRAWLFPVDSKITTETNILQYDPLTSYLFNSSRNVEDLKNNSSQYIRNAASHVWSNTDAISELEKILAEANKTLNAIKAELKKGKIND